MSGLQLTWESQLSPIDNSWTSVCFGNDLYVAVSFGGVGGEVMTSPDGINWTIRTSPDRTWRSVCFGNGLFVAVSSFGAGTRAMTSPDGITWTIRTTPDRPWYSVCYGNGLYVAVSYVVGISDTVMTSPDGINWTLRTQSINCNWESICYGDGLYVAVGGNTSPSEVNLIMTSPDGINWTSRVSPIAGVILREVCYGNGLYVAVGDSGTVITSSNGITWTLRTPSVVLNWQSICFGNGIFVAVSSSGTGNRIMVSNDGITWISNVNPEDNNWQSVCHGDNLFVSVSSTGTGDRVMTAVSPPVPFVPRIIDYGDIHIHLQNNEGNLSIFENDLKRDPTLENAIEISLFTDRRADDEDSLPDNSGNKKGYFGDIYHGNIGSKLWLLSRSKMLSDLPGRAEEYVKEALQWMIDDEVVDIINVSAEFTTSEQMLISVEVVEPKNKSINIYKYYYNWKEQRLSIGRES